MSEKALKITSIDLIPVRIPIIHEYKLGIGSLKSVENIFVKVRTDEGIVGWGESSPWGVFTGETIQTVMGVIRNVLGPAIIGENPTDIVHISGKMNSLIKGNMSSKAAIDIALHDIMGKLYKVPLSKLLGGVIQDKLPISYSVASQDLTHDLSDIKQMLNRGVKILKIKTGVLKIDAEIERIKTIREACGEGVDIRLDANQGWNLSTAKEILKKISKYDITFVEQPVPYWDINGLSRIRKEIDIPISVDESVFELYDAIRVIKEEAADIISIKLMKHGGIFFSKKIVTLSEAYGLKCYSGLMWESGIGAAASLHLAASSDIFCYGGDYYIPKYLLMDEITIDQLRVEGGFIYLPKGPGLGIEPDEDKLKKYAIH